ncbi:MAG: restriction endonuclease [Clostridia bacterium]|jgi:restriction system protein|nr:restriction endonuclease [Clostridia bacterium]
MSNIIELNDAELNQSVESLYNSFNNGYEFEEFLKIFLEKIGLEEVFVTQKSRDGGIDLTCSKNGIDGLSNLDEIKYYVQAKCYKPNTTVSIKDLRELRGIMPLNYKGIFITTGRFPKDARNFAEKDASRQIILIDGKALIQQCISLGLGFNLKPVFDEKTLEKLTLDKKDTIYKNTEVDKKFEIVISRKISQNDIRARILRIPTEIVKAIPNEQKTLTIAFSNNKTLTLSINADRTYLGGVTQLYKDLELITKDNLFVSKTSVWYYAKDQIFVEIK